MDREALIANIRNWQARVGEAAAKWGGAEICGVSKTVNPQTVNLAWEGGIRTLGENRVQELLGKFAKAAFELPQGNMGLAQFPVEYREPDLKVTELTLPETLAAGSTVEITFKVENVGNRATREDAWTDRLYLSLDPSLDEGDWLMSREASPLEVRDWRPTRTSPLSRCSAGIQTSCSTPGMPPAFS